MKRQVGRPSKLTPEVRKRFLDAVAIGNYPEVAATLAGIHPATMYRWLMLGREAQTGAYREFYEATKQAEAQAENSAVAQVRRAATSDPRNWASAMTFLERRYRDRWSRPPQVMAGAPAPGEPPPGPPNVTDEPVIIPVGERLTGILDALAAAGKLDGHGPDGSGSPTLPIQGNGRRAGGNGAG